MVDEMRTRNWRPRPTRERHSNGFRNLAVIGCLAYALSSIRVPTAHIRDVLATLTPGLWPWRPSSDDDSLSSPAHVKSSLSVPLRLRKFVNSSRSEVVAVLRGESDRLLAIVGPCSVHDPTAAREYAHRLKAVADELEQDILVIMRVNLEQPRSYTGWRGLVADPNLTEDQDIRRGLETGRRVLLDVVAAGIPVASEFVDPVVTPFFEDLVSYGIIGPKTLQSPTHQALAASLPIPVGFTSAHGGDVTAAVDAVVAARSSQRRIGMDDRGQLRAVKAPGNVDGHVVLGSEDRLTESELAAISSRIGATGLPVSRVVVDCSDALEGDDGERQGNSCRDVANVVAKGSKKIAGIILDSFLVSGNQSLVPGITKISRLRYGQSVSGACADFTSTRVLLDELSEAVRSRREFSVVVGWREASIRDSAADDPDN